MFNFFFLPHTHSSIESINCVLLSSFELKAIFLISSVKTLCVSLLSFSCIFNINLLFFTNSFLSSLELFKTISFFSKCFILFSI